LAKLRKSAALVLFVAMYFWFALFLFLYVCLIPSLVVDTLGPNDGAKGKTWGPSSCHQRERGHIINQVADTSNHNRWSKSAPNLEKHSGVRVPTFGVLQEIGRISVVAEEGSDENQQLLASQSTSASHEDGEWITNIGRFYR